MQPWSRLEHIFVKSDTDNIRFIVGDCCLLVQLKSAMVRNLNVQLINYTMQILMPLIMTKSELTNDLFRQKITNWM